MGEDRHKGVSTVIITPAFYVLGSNNQVKGAVTSDQHGAEGQETVLRAGFPDVS